MAAPLPPLFIVLHAAPGSADAQRAGECLRERLDQAGQPHELLLVRQPTDLAGTTVRAVHAARAAGGVVIAAGDDGTLGTVAQAVWNADLSMGLLPLGKTSEIGRMHGVPTGLKASVAALLRSQVQPVAVGQLGERLFLAGVRVGLHPPQRAAPAARWQRAARFGSARAADLLAVLRGRSMLTLALHAHGQTRVVRTRTLWVGCHERPLAQMGVRPAAETEAGRLVAVTLAPLSAPRTLWQVACGAAGRFDRAEQADAFLCDQLVVRPGPGVPRLAVALDGEVRVEDSPLVFQTAPRPLQLWLPSPAVPPDARTCLDVLRSDAAR